MTSQAHTTHQGLSRGPMLHKAPAHISPLFCGILALVMSLAIAWITPEQAQAQPKEPLRMSLVNVGDLYDTVGGGIGRVEHGGYTVVDLTGAYFFDEDRKHRLGLRLENAFDEKYASSLGRARTDVGSVSYAYRNLGTPQTVHVSYAYRY